MIAAAALAAAVAVVVLLVALVRLEQSRSGEAIVTNPWAAAAADEPLPHEAAVGIWVSFCGSGELIALCGWLAGNRFVWVCVVWGVGASFIVCDLRCFCVCWYCCGAASWQQVGPLPPAVCCIAAAHKLLKHAHADTCAICAEPAGVGQEVGACMSLHVCLQCTCWFFCHFSTLGWCGQFALSRALPCHFLGWQLTLSPLQEGRCNQWPPGSSCCLFLLAFGFWGPARHLLLCCLGHLNLQHSTAWHGTAAMS